MDITPIAVGATIAAIILVMAIVANWLDGRQHHRHRAASSSLSMLERTAEDDHALRDRIAELKTSHKHLRGSSIETDGGADGVAVLYDRRRDRVHICSWRDGRTEFTNGFSDSAQPTLAEFLDRFGVTLEDCRRAIGTRPSLVDVTSRVMQTGTCPCGAALGTGELIRQHWGDGHFDAKRPRVSAARRALLAHVTPPIITSIFGKTT